MQLRRLAALERQKIIDDLAEIELEIADLEDILANEARQRQIIAEELAEIVEKYGNDAAHPDHRGRRRPLDGGPDPRRGAGRHDHPRRLRQAHPGRPVPHPEAGRQGRARRHAARRRRGRALHGHLQPPLAAVLHHGRPGLPHQGLQPARGARDAKGGHVAGLLSFQPDEQIAQVLAIRDYEQAPYLVLACRSGLVKKTRLGDYNSPRQAGVIAINFREDDDELIGAELVNADDDILLVSRKGQAIRFRADDSQLRPMGRATSGVQGMKFRGGDDLLSMSVIRAEQVAAEEAAEKSAEAAEVARGGARRQAAVRLHDHRRRVRQAHPDLRLPAAVARRHRDQGDEARQRGARQPGRRVHRGRRRRGALRHQRRPGRPQPDRRARSGRPAARRWA